MSLEIIDPFKRPLPIKWENEGDEWLQHLVDFFGPQGITGRSVRTCQPSEEISSAYVEFLPIPQKLKSHLIIIPLKDEIYVLIKSQTTVPEKELYSWLMAIRAAGNRIGQDHKNFPWAAVIGPSPGIESRGQFLDAAVSVGPFLLRPASVLFAEYTKPPVPSLLARRIFWSWPIVVEGISRGYNWEVARRAATIDLHRLCGLLSVAWDRCWVVRDLPLITDPGTKTITQQEEPQVNENQVERNLVEVPPWMDSAWKLTDEDAVILDAVNAYYEGLKLFERHPSFALIAHVASVEAIGSKIYKPKRCQTCGGITGSTEQFRTALGRVAKTKDEVHRLTKAAYPRRSHTAHRGRLHGTENTFGAAFISFSDTLAKDSPTMFNWHILREIRQANKTLLEHLLSGQISV